MDPILHTEDTTHRAAIALGSNLGDRLAHLRRAVALLAGLGTLEAVSAPFETAPMYVTDQPLFLNAAAVLRVDLSPEALLEALLGIERSLGRSREEVARFGPRTIDLDLLMVDGLVYTSPALEVPHPRMRERRFVLAPLAEIAGAWMHPTLHQPIHDLLRRCPDPSEPHRLNVDLAP